jgi:hypothetical protein
MPAEAVDPELLVSQRQGGGSTSFFAYFREVSDGPGAPRPRDDLASAIANGLVDGQPDLRLRRHELLLPGGQRRGTIRRRPSIAAAIWALAEKPGASSTRCAATPP